MHGYNEHEYWNIEIPINFTCCSYWCLNCRLIISILYSFSLLNILINETHEFIFLFWKYRRHRTRLNLRDYRWKESKHSTMINFFDARRLLKRSPLRPWSSLTIFSRFPFFPLLAFPLCPPSLRRELNEGAELRGARPSKGRREKSSQPLFLPRFHRRAFSSLLPEPSPLFFVPSPCCCCCRCCPRSFAGRASRVLMLAPRFMGCCPRIPRAEEGARGGKKRISNEKRERERSRPSENKNRMREATARGGERPFWVLVLVSRVAAYYFRERGTALQISTLAPFFTRYRLRLYYIPRDSLSTIIISTRIPRLS